MVIYLCLFNINFNSKTKTDRRESRLETRRPLKSLAWPRPETVRKQLRAEITEMQRRGWITVTLSR